MLSCQRKNEVEESVGSSSHHTRGQAKVYHRCHFDVRAIGLNMGRRGELWVLAQAVLLLLFAFAPNIGPAWPTGVLIRIGGWMLVGAGSVFLAWSAFNLGRSLTPFPRPLDNGELVTGGAYRLVRHPIYCAVLMVALGFSLATEHGLRLVLTVALFAFFDMKARREECWLNEKYPAYATYALRVKKLIPWLY
jgi:protein-S-isoprenylcysteine O-methyltransferase Ste14